MIALLALLLHGDGVSSSRIEVSGREAIVTFTFSMEDLADLARLDPDRSGTVEPEEWRKVLPALFLYLGERFRIDGCRSEGDLKDLPPATPMRASVTIRMRYLSTQPLDRLRIRCTLFHEHEGNPRHVAEGPGRQVTVFDRERTAEDVGLKPSSPPALALVCLGAAAAVVAGILRSRA